MLARGAGWQQRRWCPAATRGVPHASAGSHARLRSRLTTFERGAGLNLTELVVLADEHEANIESKRPWGAHRRRRAGARWGAGRKRPRGAGRGTYRNGGGLKPMNRSKRPNGTLDIR